MSSSATATTAAIENLTLNVTQEVHVRASLETTFVALLEQLGPQNDTPDGKPMPLKLEAWPGGRWYRDLAITMAIFGHTCRPSSGRPSSNSTGHCSCPIRSLPMCNTG